MVSEKESHLFRSLLGNVAPIKSSGKVPLKRRACDSPGTRNRRLSAERGDSLLQDGLASRDYITPLGPQDILSFKRDGVQHGVFKKLRLGQYPVEAAIDLHRMSFEQARTELAGFVKDCIREEVRTALINHGKGIQRNPPALLKSSVNHWLRQLEQVLAFHSAQPQHGGSGATYVLFRKGSKRKAANRERFGLRGFSGEND